MSDDAIVVTDRWQPAKINYWTDAASNDKVDDLPANDGDTAGFNVVSSH